MPAQDGAGRRRRYGGVEGHFHRRGFSLVGYRADDQGGLENMPNAHGYRLGGHLVETLEPTFADLLKSAFLVQIDDDIGRFGFEIGGGIVKGYVSVLPDSDKGDVDRLFPNPLGESGKFCLEIGGVGGHVDEFLEGGDFFGEALAQVFSKTCFVGFAHSDIFVQMETGDLAPVDAWLFDQAGQGGELTGSGGEDDVGGAPGGDSPADSVGSEFGGPGSHYFHSFMDADIHSGSYLRVVLFRLSRHSA